ncbi:hypothetical protein [Rhizobium gallicum]|uniref:hypothetical protein n=1 Tax=Rhizobium gallicum TaxID=56730 RepID=UPI0005873460|nr:hypothetical protein [Rhizobium gallicum]TDW37108.1 hypothetical protein EV128_101583 [Rhizobium azibense]
MGSPQRLKRRAWPGAFLRSLGHASWAAEQTASGINFLGGHDQGPSPHGQAPPGYQHFGLHHDSRALAGGRVASLAGVTTHDAAGFISSANAAFRVHILRQCEAVKDELTVLSDAVSRLDQPRRYPAACLLAPYLTRATAALDSLPATIPEGILPDDQQKRIDTVRAFQAAPEQARRAAI